MKGSKMFRKIMSLGMDEKGTFGNGPLKENNLSQHKSFCMRFQICLGLIFCRHFWITPGKIQRRAIVSPNARNFRSIVISSDGVVVKSEQWYLEKIQEGAQNIHINMIACSKIDPECLHDSRNTFLKNYLEIRLFFEISFTQRQRPQNFGEYVFFFDYS